MGLQQRHTTVSAVQHRNPRRQVPPTPTPGFIPHFLAMAMIEQGESRAKLVLTLPNRSQSWNCSMIEQAHHCSFGLTKTLDFIPHFLAMAMIEQAHHCSFGLTKTLDFIPHFLAMAMIEQAHHCSFGLTKTFPTTTTTIYERDRKRRTYRGNDASCQGSFRAYERRPGT